MYFNTAWSSKFVSPYVLHEVVTNGGNSELMLVLVINTYSKKSQNEIDSEKKKIIAFVTSMFSYYLSVLSESQKKKKNSYKNGLMSMSAFGTLFRGEK